jgi:acyl transferase domain-containing protein
MIGHCRSAAGAAGIIKTTLALHNKILPPTLQCDEPNPDLQLGRTPFYINTESRPWIRPSGGAPRRAGVSAMGFGGIDAHCVLEEHPGA